MFDQFEIEANDLRYDHDVRGSDDWLLEIDRPATGTSIFMAIQMDSQRTTREVFDRYASADGDLGFEKTVVPVRFAKVGSENLVSRSQAKRLVALFEEFRTVLLDFTQVDDTWSVHRVSYRISGTNGSLILISQLLLRTNLFGSTVCFGQVVVKRMN
jgi:hypothetical protein